MSPHVARRVSVFQADETGTVNASFLQTEGVLISLDTAPGSPAPTEPFDVLLLDADGLDVLQGAGLGRDASRTTRALIQLPPQRKNARVRSHPIVRVEERLRWTVRRLSPGAQIRVSLFVGADDGSVS